jgi:hypothetical protein
MTLARQTALSLSLCLLVAACGEVSTGDADSDGGTTNDSGANQSGDGGSSDAGDGGAMDLCGYSYSGFNSSPSVNKTSEVAWTCTATQRKVTGNGIPDHTVGTFPNANCPNTIKALTVSASMPLHPASVGTASRLQPSGYAMNGVKFDPGTAGTCTSNSGNVTCSLIGNTGSWNIEALGQSSFNFGVDENNAHVQPTGDYHYHGMPNGVIAKLNKGMTPTLVGFALDGFPVYARYGYSTPMDASSAVKVIKGSYQLKTTADSGRPSTTTYPMGAFSEDYEYVAGSGDLDECNGRMDVTPEYPGGTYHYYITDTYPFIQRCVMGTATGGMMMPQGDGGMPRGDGGMMPPPGDGGLPMCGPGQTHCCGDGTCDGPENATNCPQDCP